MLMFSDYQAPQLDRVEGLTAFLKRSPVKPVLPSMAEYRALSTRAMEELNGRRLDHLGSDIVVQTPQVRSVVRQVQRTILLNRTRAAGRQGVMLSGLSTMGKTTAALAAMTYVHSQYAEAVPNFEQLGRIPVVYVEVPAGSSGKAMMGRFADFLGLPVRPRDTLEDLKRMVVPCLNGAGTKLIVVDELHNLTARTPGNGESSDVLKGLSNQVAATFVYAGVDIHHQNGSLLSGVRGAQIAGRFSLQHLRPYTTGNSAEKTLWNKIITIFEQELGLLNQVPGELLAHSEYLHEQTHGAIGTLSRLLTGAAQMLILGDHPEKEKITRDVLAVIAVDIAAQRAAEAARLRSPERGAAKKRRVGEGEANAA